jgi:hypothetical protein
MTNDPERPDERAANAQPVETNEAAERRERMRELGRLSGLARRRKAQALAQPAADDLERLADETLARMLRSGVDTAAVRAAVEVYRRREAREKREPAKREERHGYLELSPEETVGVVDQMKKMGLVVTAQERCESCGGRGKLVTLCDECAARGVDADAA